VFSKIGISLNVPLKNSRNNGEPNGASPASHTEILKCHSPWKKNSFEEMIKF
jgi:hypothetical protein